MKLEHKAAFEVIGFSSFIKPDEGFMKCPEFWEKEYTEKYARLWKTMKPETPQEHAILDNGIGMLALCIDGENGFEYMIAGIYRGGAVPEGMKLFAFPECDWAVFSATGALPASLQQLNSKVWQEWYPAEGQAYTPVGTATVEYYSAGDPMSPDYECGIWIPVKKKNDLIAYCGLDCEKCDARIATLNDDNLLREKTAKLWSGLNGIEIPPEMINCVGCRGDGVKTVYCDSMCPIRKCVLQKGLESCGLCSGQRECEALGEVLSNSAEAAENLKK